MIQEFPGGLAVKDLAWSLLWHRCDPWSGNCLRPSWEHPYASDVALKSKTMWLWNKKVFQLQAHLEHVAD